MSEEVLIRYAHKCMIEDLTCLFDLTNEMFIVTFDNIDLVRSIVAKYDHYLENACMIRTGYRDIFYIRNRITADYIILAVKQ